ncbi:MAG: carboxypeptidase regulatory-like domain-containing protein [Terracidiphilus sp.]|nr:carboxypeptidase regulatory-like domain-containing protein [Terracidiphilus sp.]
MRRIGYRFFTLLFVMLSLGVLAYSQTDRATITGTVRDTTGAVLPGAAVKATNIDTMAAYTSPSNEDGVYTIPSLPVGHYTLAVSRDGFKAYTRTGIAPVAGQVITANVTMAVGTASETVTVTETQEVAMESATEAMTMEPKAIEELPLNASYGRNALSLLTSTSPNVSEASIGASGTQNWISIAGGETFSNSIYIDGTNATAGNQGQVLTPGQDALQEMQLQTNVTDAELAQTGGGSIVLVMKSGTNRLHGSAFEYLQNEDLNANPWINNYWKSQCAAGDTACRASDSRSKFRFNDWGGSLGGPIWKNHTFVFGDYEYYKQSNLGINPTGITVPLPQMMTDNGGYYDFSPLLTMGAQTGPIEGTLNPCTGAPYNYGEVYDPTTWRTPAGASHSCADPYPNNQIPTGQVSGIGKSIAGIYNQYYQKQQPLSRLIGGNFPSYAGGAGQFWKRRIDIKVDHNFSERHHISASWNYQSDENDGPMTFATQYGGPWGGFFESADHGNHMIRAIDNYTITPSLMNTASASFNLNRSQQQPKNQVNGNSYGFSTNQKYFPLVQGLGTTWGTDNGVGFSNFGESWNVNMNFSSYNYADTVLWQKGRHAVKFGWQWTALQQNSENYNLVNNSYTFSNQTYGATDPAVSNYVGSGLAEMLLGNVYQSALNGANGYYPRQKYMALFAQDDFKANSKLTLNLGLRWDLTLPGHMSNGAWENFDPKVVNPNWAPYGGAWVFSQGSSTTFHKNIPYNQFGPHLGAAYQITPKIVAKASYSLTYVPLGVFSSGADDYRPSTQDPLNTATISLNPLNNIVGEKALQWDDPYPQPVQPPHNSTATTFGDETGSRVIYINPDFLKLGMTHTFYAGIQAQVSRGVVFDTRYLGTFGRRLQDSGAGYDVSWPQWNAYHALLRCQTPTGVADLTSSAVGSAGDAANLATECGSSVPYPYAGFSGPARAAIAPYPQLAAGGTQLEVAGDTSTSAKSDYNSFVAELKVRNSHGLYVDWSYTFSKFTTNSTSAGWGTPTNFSNVWNSTRQSAADVQMWPVTDDQRHLAKGYLTYDLPFGTHHKWLNQSSTLDYFVGGWTLGYYGAYGSGTPIGTIGSPYKLNYYYSNQQRAVFANGANAGNIRNAFPRKHFNPSNLTSSTNYDFDQSIVQTKSSWYYNNDRFFGDTPLTFNKWRWNSSPASENISIVKHFGIGKEGRYTAQLRAEFYNAFNRHGYNAPDINPNDSTFGYVTSVAGSPRVGQVAARFDF